MNAQGFPAWYPPLCLSLHPLLLCLSQEYEADMDENNAAVSRMRNALAAEADEAAKAEEAK